MSDSNITVGLEEAQAMCRLGEQLAQRIHALQEEDPAFRFGVQANLDNAAEDLHSVLSALQVVESYLMAADFLENRRTA